MRHAIIQTPVFRNINIFFSYSNVWFLHLHSTKNYTQTCRPAVHNCYDLGAAGGCRRGRRGRKGWVFTSFLLKGGYTHILRKVEGLYIIFFLDTVHSTPPPIHGPSFFHSVAFSLDRHHVHAHTINYTLYFLSISLSFTLFFARFILCLLRVALPIFFRSFSPLLIIYIRARSCLSFSYSATFKYRIFRNN